MREGVGSPAQGGAARTSGNATPGDGRGKSGAPTTCQCRQDIMSKAHEGKDGGQRQ
jgi:hypothetical protein